MNTTSEQFELSPYQSHSLAQVAQWDMALWLDYIEDIERGRGIRLGLERIAGPWNKLGSPRPAPTVVTVAGTNGKGSVVNLLYESLCAHGVRAGCYTSPHLHLFNERIACAGRLARDEECVQAFRRVYEACAHDRISYFEYITLAALVIMRDADLDIAILEVGLGGRYDAVNIIDADLAILTSVGMDHCDFLGHELSAIAREKCGIMRANKPILCALAPTPHTREITTVIEQESRRCGSSLLRAEHDWHWRAEDNQHWHYHSRGYDLSLPIPASCGITGLDNAAVTVQALEHLLPKGINEDCLAQVCSNHHLAGRFQFGSRHPHILFDTAHNAPAVARLLERVAQSELSIASILLNARRDKDLPGMLAQFTMPVSSWHCLDFGSDYYSASELRAHLSSLMDAGTIPSAPILCFTHPDQAVSAISARCDQAHAVRLVCGSFIVLSKMMQLSGEVDLPSSTATAIVDN